MSVIHRGWESLGLKVGPVTIDIELIAHLGKGLLH